MFFTLVNFFILRTAPEILKEYDLLNKGHKKRFQ